MIYLKLFYEFAKIGLFSVGGGMAAVPFLQQLGESSGWFDSRLVSEMIAISESTPGPIGINMATYVGYEVAGIIGAIIASLAISLPSMLIAYIVFKSLQKFAGSKLVGYVFYGLRPGSIALVCTAAFTIVIEVFLGTTLSKIDFSTLVIDYKKLIYFAIVFAAIMLTKKYKWAHPVIFIVISAVVGIVLKL